MDKIKRYFISNFEQIFVLLILLATVMINYAVPQKIAFLNFYFLPVILGAYYLGKRKAMLGAVFIVLAVTAYVVLRPSAFMTESTEQGVYLNVLVWGCFLILAGAVVGAGQDKLQAEISRALGLNRKLSVSEEELQIANESLQDINSNLEQHVRDRTEELEKSKGAVESLKKKVEDALYATMDAAVVNLMIEGRLRNEKRPMSVMFSDLMNFTSYSENTRPENVVADLNRYLQDMEPLLLAYRGHIDKYMGDGIMCEFGVPIEYETHALMAVTCAYKMQQMLVKREHPWAMRIGIASGSAIAGLIGSRRQTYTAIGDIVNLAARLERFCTPGNILVDKSTYQEIEPFFVTRQLRALPTRNDLDLEKEEKLDALFEQLRETPDNAELNYRTGQIYLQIDEPLEALQYFERALQLEPGSAEYKIAYAETGIRRNELEKISVKGKRQRVEAYEVIGMKDPLDNREKIPQAFHNRYRHIADQIQIPDDIVLPSEVLDGCVGHARVVAVLSYAMAEYFELSEREKSDILRAAYLADIGKELVPHHLLNRRGGLSASELEFIKQHPEESTRMMRKLGYDNRAQLELVRYSHEFFTGGGYPDQFTGTEIPLGSRIIAVADAYDALTSRRSYRESWERHAVLGEIRQGVHNGIFDPTVVDALAALLN